MELNLKNYFPYRIKLRNMHEMPCYKFTPSSQCFHFNDVNKLHVLPYSVMISFGYDFKIVILKCVILKNDF
jgi:hypothetical protein